MATAAPEKPKRFYASTYGPKPSFLFKRCMGKPLLRWILRVSGAEAVLEFALARERFCEGAERKYWGHLATTASNQADREFSQRELLRKERYEQSNPISKLSWEERRAMLIEREKQKRGLEQAFKSPAAPVPSKKPVRVLQAVPEVIAPSAGLSRNEEPEETSFPDGPEERPDSRPAPGGASIPEPAPHCAEAVEGEGVKSRHRGRIPIGECGQRIGRKIDKLLGEIRSDETFSSEDSPAITLGNDERCVDEPAADGGVSGFSLPPEPEPTPAPQAQTIEEPFATAWDCLCGQGQSLSDLREFLQELQDTPELRAGATLRTLTRIRWELERTPENARLNDPIVIMLRDAAVLMSQMLSRVR